MDKILHCFWVSTTALMINILSSGNVAAYLQTAVSEDVTGFRWHYDFHKVQSIKNKGSGEEQYNLGEACLILHLL